MNCDCKLILKSSFETITINEWVMVTGLSKRPQSVCKTNSFSYVQSKLNADYCYNILYR